MPLAEHVRLVELLQPKLLLSLLNLAHWGFAHCHGAAPTLRYTGKERHGGRHMELAISPSTNSVLIDAH